MLHEFNGAYREVYLDGRPLPVNPNPTWNGYSTAHWDRDTLVVQTTGFRDGMWLDRAGSPLTDAAKITERLRRPNFGKLDIDLTVDDPKAYTKPWTITLHHNIVLNTDLLDYICNENEHSEPHLTDK